MPLEVLCSTLWLKLLPLGASGSSVGVGTATTGATEEGLGVAIGPGVAGAGFAGEDPAYTVDAVRLDSTR